MARNKQIFEARVPNQSGKLPNDLFNYDRRETILETAVMDTLRWPAENGKTSVLTDSHLIITQPL